MELGLRPFLTAAGPPPPQIELDSLTEPLLVRKQYDEGVSVFRFSRGGARATGNLPMTNAPVVVILGDSYVVAEAVEDDETMGSRLERTARAAGMAINIRQYGWSGASPSRYLMVAGAVLHRWNPPDVIIVLSDNDLDFNALWNARPRLRVSRENLVEIVPPLPPDGPDRPVDRFALASAIRQRTWEFGVYASRSPRIAVREAVTSGPHEPAALPDSVQLARLPGAVVRSLAARFGDRLSLLYLAQVGITGDDSVTTIERSLLNACQETHLRCASTRTAMLKARRTGIIAHGFSNTTPGNGHLNAAGHQIAGDAMWALLHARRETRLAGR
jgi:hypothetical protein